MLDQNSSDLVVEDIPGLGWSASPDGRLRFINPDVLELIGVTPAEMRKMMETDPIPLRRFGHPDVIEENAKNWARALRTGEPLIDESLVIRHDGEYRVCGTPLFLRAISAAASRPGMVTASTSPTRSGPRKRCARASVNCAYWSTRFRP
jgi:PAS domain-containing protein